MLRPGELQYVGSGFENGVPAQYFRDFYGGRWVCMDFEAQRRQHENETRNRLNQAHKQGDTKAVSYHKRKFVRR